MKSVVELPLEDVAAGQVLGADILDERGGRILASGAVLTEQMLDLLGRRGINAVSVTCEEKLSPAELDAKRREVAARLADMFRKVEGDPFMQEFRKILFEYRMRQYE